MNMVSHTHSPASTGAPYLAGNFGPVADETTAFGLDVIGRIPPELNARFLKIGPNPAADSKARSAISALRSMTRSVFPSKSSDELRQGIMAPPEAGL